MKAGRLMQAGDTLTWTTPEPEAEAHSLKCRRYIAERIAAAGGVLSFAEFMQHALYAPGLGYYTAGSRKFGVAGDFVTAPEISSLFGYVLARQIAPTIRSLSAGDVLEIGAGSGKLAADVLTRLESLDALPARYLILEISADLAARQRDWLTARVPALAERVVWLDDWPTGFRGAVLVNEVLDALPAERFVYRGGSCWQQGVCLDAGQFRFTETPPPDWLAARLEALRAAHGAAWPEGYTSEIVPAARAWIAALAARLSAALVLLFDYGLPGAEYYAPARRDGWLRCHYRHRAHDDPLILTGIQDITTWVDFTALAEAAVDSGLSLAGFGTQAAFLLAGGLADELDGGAPERALALSREAKLLTLPGEMGEHFKYLSLLAGDVEPPKMPVHGDQRHRL